MAKLLTTASFVTQSAPSTPSSGYGTLYASGSSLFYKNSSGTNYNLSIVGSSSFTFFTSSGTWTYNTGSGIQYIKVVCVGGGGGGGSGRTISAASGNRNGGAGGAGGNVNMAYFSSQSLTTGSYTVTVGGYGAGGARQTGTNNNGNAGQAGLDSTFASGSTVLVRGVGGPGGSAGTATNSVLFLQGGINTLQSTSSVPNPRPPFYVCGADGGDTGGGQASGAGNALGSRWIAGGGGGGAINASNVTVPGGSGSAIYNGTVLIQSGSPGASGNPGDNGAPVLDILPLFYYSGSNITTGIRIGTGGHGGSGGIHSPASSGGNGGSGSVAAGGGGGGGCNGAAGLSSGAGGPGGDGFVIIFEYY